MNFESFLRTIGLIPKDLTPGKWHRCSTEMHPKKKNGSYKIGDSGTIGWAIDFATMTEPAEWRGGESKEYTVDREALNRAAKLRSEDQAKAILGAREYFQKCSLMKGTHPYLKKKGFEGAFEWFRVDSKGWLVVPMGRSIQRISPEGEKKFWPGAPTKGAKLVLNRKSNITILAEGVATGMTLYDAVPMANVVIGFNAGNLPVVAEELKLKGMAAIAADNDKETEKKIGRNPGVESASVAARILGCGIAIPQCQGSDWNDYYLEKVKERTEVASLTLKSRTRISDIHKAVNAEIMREVMKVARMCCNM